MIGMWRPIAVLVVGGVAAAAPMRAQEGREGIDYTEFNVPYDGRFTFVRLRFDPLPSWTGGGFRGRDLKWDHDWPRAERHFTKMLAELTVTGVNQTGSNILALDDPALFKYPVAYLSEPGFWTLTEAEAEGLRNYLRKGGFVIFDDFVGRQWLNFEEMITKVLPDARMVELDVSHPIFHSFFDIERLDYDHPVFPGNPSVFLGIFEDNDPDERLMAIVNYNNDIGEYWEWSDTGFLPISLSNEAYKIGINYIVYAMTH